MHNIAVFLKPKLGLLIWCASIFAISVYAKESACTVDIAKFCASIPSGDQHLVKCLRAHEAELSEICRAASQTLKQQETKIVTACGMDIFRYCSMVQPGGGRIVRCLKENEAKLSPECLKIRQQKQISKQKN